MAKIIAVVALLCADQIPTDACTKDNAIDFIERRASDIECAMPWGLFPEIASIRADGARWVIRCSRRT